MTVVRTVIIAVVSLCVPGSLVAADVVELNRGVVAAPGPETCGGFGHGQYVGAVAHHVVLDEGAVATDGNDTVAGHFFDKVVAHYGMLAGEPVAAVVIAFPDHGVTRAAHDVAVLDDEAVEARTYLFAFVDDVDAAASAQFLDGRPVDVADGESVDADVVRHAVVAAFYLQTRTQGQGLLACVYDFEVAHGKVFRIEDAYGIERGFVAYNAGFGQCFVSVGSYDDGLCGGTFSVDFELPVEGGSPFQQHLFAGSKGDFLDFLQALPSLVGRSAGVGIVSCYGVDVVGGMAVGGARTQLYPSADAGCQYQQTGYQG